MTALCIPRIYRNATKTAMKILDQLFIHDIAEIIRSYQTSDLETKIKFYVNYTKDLNLARTMLEISYMYPTRFTRKPKSQSGPSQMICDLYSENTLVSFQRTKCFPKGIARINYNDALMTFDNFENIEWNRLILKRCCLGIPVDVIETILLATYMIKGNLLA